MIAELGPREVKYFKIDSASGTFEVVAAVSGKRIRVLSWYLSNSGAAACTVKWQSAAVDLTGPLSLANDVAGSVAQFNPAGHFQTAAGAALNITQSGTEQLGGYGSYIEM